MKIILVKLSDIKEAEFNYNLHPQNQIDELCKSLKEFGQFKNIVLWNGFCIAGNGLAFAARALGWDSLNAVVMDDLTEDQAKRLCVADNATPYLADPDPDRLRDLLKSLPSFDDIPGVDDAFLDSVDLSFDALFGDTGDENEPPEEKPPDDNYKEQYGVIVICENESDQETAYNNLLTQGYNCKVVVT